MSENPKSADRVEIDEWFTTGKRLQLAAGLGILVVVFEFAFSLIHLVTEGIIHFSLLLVGLYVVFTMVEYLYAELATE